MRKTLLFSFPTVIACALGIVAFAPQGAYGQACAGGGTFLCSSCATAHYSGLASPAPANARITWWDFNNRSGNRGILGSTQFGCPGGCGDTCTNNIGGTSWIIELGDWFNACNCTAGGAIADTSILVENFATNAFYAFINARDTSSPNADMDAALNTGTSVLTANPIPTVSSITPVGVTGGSCPDTTCLDITFTLTDFTATSSSAKDGGNVLTTSTGGWVVYRQNGTVAGQTRTAGWLVAALSGGGAASQNIAAGGSITVRVDDVTQSFVLAPAFGGTGVTCRTAGTASNTSDTTCAAQETIWLSPSITVVPGNSFGLFAKASYGANPQTVNLEWSAAMETNTAGYNIYRLPPTGSTGVTKKINSSLIPAQGAGTVYTRTDSMPNNTSYIKYNYKFEMIDTSGGVQTFITVATRVPLGT